MAVLRSAELETMASHYLKLSEMSLTLAACNAVPPYLNLGLASNRVELPLIHPCPCKNGWTCDLRPGTGSWHSPQYPGTPFCAAASAAAASSLSRRSCSDLTAEL